MLQTIEIKVVISVRGKTVADVYKKDSSYISQARPDRENSVIAPYIYYINSRS